MRITTSITDFAPLLGNLTYLFKGLQHTGVDGVELVLGVKSRWKIQEVQELSQRYKLPILSIHQPIWSGVGLYFDDGFMEYAKDLNVESVVCHPLPNISWENSSMQIYLKRLAKLQKKWGIPVLLENLPTEYNNKFISKIFIPHIETGDLKLLHTHAAAHQLNIAFDTDHFRKKYPPDNIAFHRIFPSIKNIHLSSFSKHERHLPLYLGELEVQRFIKFLLNHSYSGLLTLEIYYPKLINFLSYDFNAIKKSVDIVKSTIYSN